MSAIYLIRHGQASFASENYDQLSSLGEQQTTILGQHWQHLANIDKAYRGELVRHKQSSECFFRGYYLKEISTNPINLVIKQGFNEFDHLDILAQYNKQWQNQQNLQDFIIQHSGESVRVGNKVFQQEFSQAIKRWVIGKHDDEYKQTWQQFKQLTVTALNELIAENSTREVKNIIVFTSGGPISVIVGHILALDDQHVFAVNQQLINSSVTKLLFNSQRLSVDYINNYSHLEWKNSNLISHR
ncbi:MAG: histidine phosphatase family protein [Alteromonadaceae bacterium]|nr:histidine phosphatase family protein [Alteromonadaceae bacterium]